MEDGKLGLAELQETKIFIWELSVSHLIPMHVYITNKYTLANVQAICQLITFMSIGIS